MASETARTFQAVFVDRDGTIGGTGHFIHPRDFMPFPGVTESLSVLKNAGLLLFAFTNQHQIAKGRATEEDFLEEFRRLGFDGAYICPHEEGSGCQCRKPAPGLLLKAANDHHLDLTRCVVIGDTGATDMLAAHRVGAVKILVRTGWGVGSLTDYRHTWAEVEPDYVAHDLPDAAEWILNRMSAASPGPVAKVILDQESSFVLPRGQGICP